MHIVLFGANINWLAQLLDMVGFVFILISYQQKKIPLLLLSGIACFIFTLEAIVYYVVDGTNTIANIISSGVGLIRNIMIIYSMKKYKKELPKWIAVLIVVITWIANIPFFKEWFTYIPCIALTAFTMCAVQKNIYIVKLGADVNEILFLVYYFVTGGYFGAIREVVLIISIFVSIILMIIADKKRKKQQKVEAKIDSTIKVNS